MKLYSNLINKPEGFGSLAEKQEDNFMCTADESTILQKGEILIRICPITRVPTLIQITEPSNARVICLHESTDEKDYRAVIKWIENYKPGK